MSKDLAGWGRLLTDGLVLHDAGAAGVIGDAVEEACGTESRESLERILWHEAVAGLRAAVAKLRDRFEGNGKVVAEVGRELARSTRGLDRLKSRPARAARLSTILAVAVSALKGFTALEVDKQDGLHHRRVEFIARLSLVCSRLLELERLAERLP